MKNIFKELVTVASSPFLNLYQINYLNKNNEIKKWMVASRKTNDVLKEFYNNQSELKSDAVVIYAIHQPSNKLVILKQHRMPLNDYVYELPAGLIDVGESIASCVKRELKEETGLDLVEITQAPVQLISTPGLSEEAFEFVHCVCTGEISKDYLEPDEDIFTYLMNKEDLKQLLTEKPKMDIKAYHGCQQYLNEF